MSFMGEEIYESQRIGFHNAPFLSFEDNYIDEEFENVFKNLPEREMTLKKTALDNERPWSPPPTLFDDLIICSSSRKRKQEHLQENYVKIETRQEALNILNMALVQGYEPPTTFEQTQFLCVTGDENIICPLECEEVKRVHNPMPRSKGYTLLHFKIHEKMSEKTARDKYESDGVFVFAAPRDINSKKVGMQVFGIRK